MSKLKIGAQLYTIRNFMKTEADFTQSMAKIAKIGYKYVQVSGIGDVSPKCIKEATEANGLKVILTHSNPARMLTNIDDVIAEHDLFNCNGIGVGGIHGVNRSYDGFMKFCENFAPVIEKIKAAGKTFLYHNHRFEFEQFEGGKTGEQIILDNTDKDGCKLTYDIYWAQSGGIDSSDFIIKNKDRIFATHCKDMSVLNNEIIMVELLTGNLNYNGIFKTALEVGQEWHFVELDTTRIDPFDALKISYDNAVATGMFEK